FGPYVTDGSKNVKIPKTIAPTDITHEQAKEMLQKAPAKKKAPTKRPATKKPRTKK
ncbi:hypothetical protein KBE46_03255, partial [Candidatus Saccharibacteria bacterium]|nr:hypothetical protein [Candidatus Saccharibacteria bacterium]